VWEKEWLHEGGGRGGGRSKKKGQGQPTLEVQKEGTSKGDETKGPEERGGRGDGETPVFMWAKRWRGLEQEKTQVVLHGGGGGKLGGRKGEKKDRQREAWKVSEKWAPGGECRCKKGGGGCIPKKFQKGGWD